MAASQSVARPIETRLAGDMSPPSPSASSSKLASIFQRHELKFLNLGLVIYLCFGVILFELLGEFNQDASSVRLAALGRKLQIEVPGGGGSGLVVVGAAQNKSRAAAGPPSTLVELRETSARRMWNITNRLNILYESNWTRLVLDELQEFERQLLDRLMEEAAAVDSKRAAADGDDNNNNNNDDYEGDDSNDDDSKDSDQKKRQKQERGSKSRMRSMKKSLIHSLSTITTVGFAQRVESSAAKLATVIYGLLGIPLLVTSVSRTGKQAAHSARNGLLLIRHYCFSLPLYYLCCSCNLLACFRCLTWWCCCCCCCSYLCCCLDGGDKAKYKCCDPSGAPRLKLASSSRLRCRKRYTRRRRRQRRPLDGATSPLPGHQQQTAFVIAAPSSGDGSSLEDMQPQGVRTSSGRRRRRKSVRFSGSNSSKTKNLPVEDKREDQDDDDDDEDDYEDEDYETTLEQEQEEEDEFHYTRGVFLTSLSVLSVYLLLGAYFHSTYTNSSLIDALFVCYSLLSTSKFPSAVQDQQQQQQTYWDPRTLYERLNSTAASPRDGNGATAEPGRQKFDWIESETISWIYLLIGLNIISACGHFAQIWISGRLHLRARRASGSQKSRDDHEKSAPAIFCNGDARLMLAAGSLQSRPEIGANLQVSNQLQLAPNINQLMGSQAGAAAAADSYCSASGGYYQKQHTVYQQSPGQPQVDLKGLFLIPSQDETSGHDSAPHELQFVAGSHIQSQQIASDASLTSVDRSTSLCHHHQQQQQQQQQHGLCQTSGEQPNGLYVRSIYNDANNQQRIHHRVGSQSHLYLPAMSARVLDSNDDAEVDEMSLMLKSCLMANEGNNLDGLDSASRLRSRSSSSSQLSQAPGPMQLQQANHVAQQQLSGASNSSSGNTNNTCTLSRSRASLENRQQQQQQQLQQNGHPTDSSSFGAGINQINNESSTATSCNTISSTASSRTLKLPKHRPPPPMTGHQPHIGFVFAPSPLNNNNN